MITITVKIETMGEGVQLAVSSEAQNPAEAEKAIAHIINTGLVHATTFISERCKESFLIGGKNIPSKIHDVTSPRESDPRMN